MQVKKRRPQVGGSRTAQAARGDLADRRFTFPHQQMVDGNITELVDDHRGVGKTGLVEQLVQQGRFAGAEKPAQQKNRYPVGNSHRIYIGVQAAQRPRSSIVDFFSAKLASWARLFRRLASALSVISMTLPQSSHIMKAVRSWLSHPG